MDQLSENLPGIISLALIVGVCAFAGIRVGPRFLIRRLAGVIFVLFGVTFITFILGYFAPGNAILSQLGGHAPLYIIHRLEAAYGFNLPWYEQYARFLNGLVHFDLGYSYIDKSRTVTSMLAGYVPTSAQLGITATVLAVLVGVPLGLYAAVRSNSAYDTSIQTVSLVFFALPTFVLIPLYQLANIKLHEANLPSFSVTGWDTWDAMVGPILIFGAGIFAFFLRITRASMLEVLRQDYVRTARAKGLRESRVIWWHAFRNALINLLTAIGPALAFAVGGVFVVELLFNIPGIGVESLQAINQRDYPVVQGTVILIAVAIAFANLVTDIAYGLVDPRIKTV
jgi:peptide/nickel transport system permease protein/oligopeptide transport system permease protein